MITNGGNSTSRLKKNTYGEDDTHSRRYLRWLIAVTLSLVLIAAKVLLTFGYNSLKTQIRAFQVDDDLCTQPNPAAKASNHSRFVHAPGYANLAAERLAGAVKIPTMWEYSVVNLSLI